MIKLPRLRLPFSKRAKFNPSLAQVPETIEVNTQDILTLFKPLIELTAVSLNTGHQNLITLGTQIAANWINELSSNQRNLDYFLAALTKLGENLPYPLPHNEVIEIPLKTLHDLSRYQRAFTAVVSNSYGKTAEQEDFLESFAREALELEPKSPLPRSIGKLDTDIPTHKDAVRERLLAFSNNLAVLLYRYSIPENPPPAPTTSKPEDFL